MAEKVAKKTVVIVGGGAAGGGLARDLSKKLDASLYNLVLVNDRTFYVHLIAMARVAVSGQDKLEDKALFGFDNLFYNGNGTVKIGKAVAISEAGVGKGGELVLEDGEKIPYTSLVLATGSTWPSIIHLPGTESEAKSYISSWRSRVEKAQHVVVVGGGAVGIELVGEIREAHPTKKITLIHNQSLLLNSVYPDKFRKDIERRVRLRNIDVILGDAIENPVEGVAGVTTKNGKSIPDADLVIQAFGSKPNTEFVKSLGDGVVNEHGFVKVNEFLEVPGHPGVFAVGDIIDWKEQKQAAKANNHIKVVAANVLSFLQGKPLKQKYKGSAEMILIPLGKSGGAGYLNILWGFILGDWVSRTMKGKDLFVSMARSQRGLKG
ncbi:FAD/NAD(P)-binding domain-containing protein [Polyporus arcularius HHB13444]|uniref:FAD/NAD(P)-binding domain-containing protein n=1 Tax=Polyporus arcularius HHB13444 TaxID=1314778 RepID=A0A5C3NXM2_9APHY|nr:FAD/NAD(P)-binding domain-containing protein [Polyporus arcularius HHB13444]